MSDNPGTGPTQQAEVIRRPAPGGASNSVRATPPGAGPCLVHLPRPVPCSHEDSDRLYAHMREQLDRHGRCKAHQNEDSVWALVMFAHQSERTLLARDLVTAYDLLEWLRREHGVTTDAELATRVTPDELAGQMYGEATGQVMASYETGASTPLTWDQLKNNGHRASVTLWLTAAAAAIRVLGGASRG